MKGIWHMKTCFWRGVHATRAAYSGFAHKNYTTVYATAKSETRTDLHKYVARFRCETTSTDQLPARAVLNEYCRGQNRTHAAAVRQVLTGTYKSVDALFLKLHRVMQNAPINPEGDLASALTVIHSHTKSKVQHAVIARLKKPATPLCKQVGIRAHMETLVYQRVHAALKAGWHNDAFPGTLSVESSGEHKTVIKISPPTDGSEEGLHQYHGNAEEARSRVERLITLGFTWACTGGGTNVCTIDYGPEQIVTDMISESNCPTHPYHTQTKVNAALLAGAGVALP